MKYSLLILILSVSACQSTQKDNLSKAKEAVIAKLKESANDWKSYQPVKWGKLDSSYTTFSDDSTYIAAGEIFDDAIKKSRAASETADIWMSSFSSYGRSRFQSYFDEAKKYHEVAKVNLAIMDSISKTFKPLFNGYKLEHSYRMNNANGHLTIAHDQYVLDRNFKVVKILDVSKNYYDNEDEKKQ